MAQSKNLEKTIAKIESRSREAVWVSIDNVKPYPNNPRDNEAAVDKVKASIERYGFNVPICVDKNGVIVTGHTRYKAALKIGMQKVLVIYLKDLTKDEIDSFRLVDNKVSEFASWDCDKLHFELSDLDMKGIDLTEFGFSLNMDDIVEEEEEEDNHKSREYTCPFCGEKWSS